MIWTEAEQARVRAWPTSWAGWQSGPARLAGLATKGAIEVGRDADLVAFAPEEQFVVRADQLLTRHRLTPYEGQELRGVVRRTWLRGAQVEAGQLTGRLLRN